MFIIALLKLSKALTHVIYQFSQVAEKNRRNITDFLISIIFRSSLSQKSLKEVRMNVNLTHDLRSVFDNRVFLFYTN